MALDIFLASLTGIVYAAAFAIPFVIYLLPTVIAKRRHHRNQTPIFIVNLFFGWTILIWILTLAWSYSGNVEGDTA